MNRQEKQNLVHSLKQGFEGSQASFIINVKGLTVEEVQGLRKSLRLQNGKLKVAKNTLFRRATEEVSGLDVLSPYFKDQTAVVFAQQDSPSVAKILFKKAKNIEHLQLVVGALDKQLISKEQIEFLATLPPKDVLLGHVGATLKMPITGLAVVLKQLIQRLLWVIAKIEAQKNSNK